MPFEVSKISNAISMTKDLMNIKQLLVYMLRKIIEIYQWGRVTKYCITFFGEHLAA